MTTKPSDAPWADEPFALIPTPIDSRTHACVRVAAKEMSQAHNLIIRGLNAIILQAPYVPDATAGPAAFNPRDVSDLLFYIRAWVKMINHHHAVEESFIFPEIEKLPGASPGCMEAPREQHELFHDGLQRFAAYADATKPEEYRWEGAGGMREIVDGFSQDLIDHLRAEVELLLRLDHIDSDGFERVWHEGEKVAKKSGGLSVLWDVFPLVLGGADKTYEGGSDFPPLPGFIPYLIKYWFAAGNGAFRFSPCDFWGRPRPLAFGPGAAGSSSA